MIVPFLSIITVNFNNAEGLERTITSVVSQSFTDYEYLIIDGGSTDNSIAVVENFKKEITHWVSERDTGVFNAMNKGIAASKGQYLLFLNGGDVFTSKNVLKRFIEHPKFGGDIIYGDYQFENGEKRYPDVLPPDYFMRTSLPHQSTLFKRTVFETMGHYDEKYKIGADRAFYIKCQVAGNIEFRHVPVALSLFDLSGMSNDDQFSKEKEAEDMLLQKEGYGEKYELYKANIEVERRLKVAERNSFSGILKRIGKRIESLWKHPS
ncbi:glycosyltransferase involved in cell wall biosynthesis [Ulvibacter sp. MAR_2010_11]|uniref:glycosyltransferase family 2 protein n=1 Tax=Ulvibacter sp. MAR_2010_11 TaxID=1250229 RepID=UPI000C2B642B|nr:glycosyltransferase family 2 protein [Ulvibacter sp. MAR_2010_11]PKA82120.1 glycosyltransferase involved in cell wall biosynthesis [Ulvibacter sp. MAR_2010_11]